MEEIAAKEEEEVNKRPKGKDAGKEKKNDKGKAGEKEKVQVLSAIKMQRC